MRLRALLAAAVIVAAVPAHAADPAARAAFSRRRIMPTDMVDYTITLTADRLPRSTGTPQPDFSEFEVLDGPRLSRSQQISIVNGQVAQWEVRTFSWVLQPKKEGQLQVPAVTVDIGDGRSVQASRAAIEVVTGSAMLPPSGGSPGGGTQPPPPVQDRRARAERSVPWQRATREPKLELVAQVDRTEAWLGQELSLSHLLRYDVSVGTFAPRTAPDFPGFANAPLEIEQPEGHPVRDPATGAVAHHEAILARWSLVPLAVGNQVIPALGYTMTLEDPLSFFQTRGRQVNVSTQPVTIRVKPHPAGAPASFAGAVGSFRMDASVDATHVRAGDGLTLTIVIEGTGSLRGVTAPVVSVPQGMKSFDAEVSEQGRLDADARTHGSKTFRYPLLVTAAGTHEIPVIEWTFFDPSSARYVTRQAGPFTLTATPGEPASVQQVPLGAGQAERSVEARGEDIRHVPATLRPWTPDLAGSSRIPGWFWAALAAGPALNAALLLLAAISRATASDPTQQRARGAGKRARGRLKEARAALAAGRGLEASDAVARAVAGAVSDRLQLGAHLAPGEAAAALVQAGAPQLAADVERLLSDCDVARFASGAAGTDPAELVRRGEDLVGRIVSARFDRREAA